MSVELKIAIRDDFGSLNQLKLTFSAAAMGLSTSGWVWFVVDDAGYTAVIPTFGAGTLLVRSRTMMSPGPSITLGETMELDRLGPTAPRQSRWNQPPPLSIASRLTRGPPQSVPRNSNDPPSRSIHATLMPAYPPRNMYNAKAAGLHGHDIEGDSVIGRENVANFSNIGRTIYPLFCISVYEHAWLSAGYGIWGKEEYLKKFWTVLDWKKVSDAFRKFSPSTFG
jgi:superoxide dismutase, Fe-Mn family